MFSCLQRVVKQNTVEDDALLAGGEVTPATHADERASITCLLGNKQNEQDGSEDGNQTLNYYSLALLLYSCRSIGTHTQEDPSPPRKPTLSIQLQQASGDQTRGRTGKHLPIEEQSGPETRLRTFIPCREIVQGTCTKPIVSATTIDQGARPDKPGINPPSNSPSNNLVARYAGYDCTKAWNVPTRPQAISCADNQTWGPMR